jgi:hypothetical protein
LNDSNYWGPPRHDLPLTHATPNPTDSYRDPGLGGGGNWSTPVNTSYGGSVGSGTVGAGSGIGGSLGPAKRSALVAALLAFFLGPLGLFYVGVLHGIAALIALPFVVRFLAFAIAIAIGGGPDTVFTIAVPILWCIAIPWAIIGVKIRNARIERAASQKQ